MNFTTTIEWHPVTLPSKGKYYGGKVPGGKVSITPWTVAQEEVIVRYSATDPAEMAHQLVRTNLQLPEGMKYEDLLLTDQFFLLVHLRCISFVPHMTLPHLCPKCKEVSLVQMDLSEMPTKTSEPTDADEPFPCFLPKRKMEVTLKFQRIADGLAAAKYEEECLVKKPEVNRKFLYARQIVSVKGESLKMDEKLDFVSGLPLIDLQAMNYVLEDLATGLTGKAKAKCSKCSHEDESWIPPIYESFFRPLGVDIDTAIRMARQP